MLNPRGLVCPFCEVRSAVYKTLKQPSWQQTRLLSSVQKKRPPRMSLSPNVAQPIPSAGQAKRPVRRDQGPFAGMNKTHAGLKVEAERRRALERSTRKKAHGQGLKTERTALAVDPLERRRERTRLRNTRKREEAPKSSDDMKALRMQRALSSISYAHRSSIKQKISDIESFGEFPLLQVIQQAVPEEALKGMASISPTPIQRLAIPALLGVEKTRSRATVKRGKHFLLAAETGSGKTLAYLLPVLDAVKRADEEEIKIEEEEVAVEKERKKPFNPFALDSPPLSNQPDADVARPKAVILVPTSELVEQVGKLFKSFSHVVKLRVALLSASYTAPIIRRRLFGPSGIDIVITTPHLLDSIANSDPNILSRVSHLVADEADSLFDRSFAPITTSIIDRANPSLKQLILCSATIPRSLDTFLQKRYPDIRRLATPNLHAIPRRVQLSVVDIDREPYRGNRDLACADSIWSLGRAASEMGDELSAAEAKRIIVFVNERSKAVELAEYLLTKGIDAVSLHRDTLDQRRDEILSSFTSADDGSRLSSAGGASAAEAASPSSPAVVRPQRILANTKVIVMTDLGSRGIDTVAVRNVILYDVPHTTIDFIHRLGRTGRMGRRGRGLVLVGRYDRKDVVREVREGMFRGQALI